MSGHLIWGYASNLKLREICSPMPSFRASVILLANLDFFSNNSRKGIFKSASAVNKLESLRQSASTGRCNGFRTTTISFISRKLKSSNQV